MKWEEIRIKYPHQWLLVEAIDAHSESNYRIVEQFSVINSFEDSDHAIESYSQLHQKSPDREMYVIHTDKKTVDIKERRWLGIRK